MGIVQTICDKLYVILSAGSVLIFFILYKLITKTLWVKEIKTHLVQCINLLGSEFKKTLISDPEAKFNSYLLQYLETGDKMFLAEAASYLKDKQRPSRWKPYTEPSIVMIALIKQIVREQLKEEYTKGFAFDSDKFEKLEKIAPFVHAYCVKIKFNGRDKYYTDFLKARPGDSMNDIICHSIEEVKSKVGEKENPAVEIMSLPSRVICIVKNGYGAIKYKFTSFQASDLIVSSYFTKYVITGLLLRSQGWFFRTYEAVGGDEFSPDDIKLIEKKFNAYIWIFISNRSKNLYGKSIKGCLEIFLVNLKFNLLIKRYSEKYLLKYF